MQAHLSASELLFCCLQVKRVTKRVVQLDSSGPATGHASAAKLTLVRDGLSHLVHETCATPTERHIPLLGLVYCVAYLGTD